MFARNQKQKMILILVGIGLLVTLLASLVMTRIVDMHAWQQVQQALPDVINHM